MTSIKKPDHERSRTKTRRTLLVAAVVLLMASGNGVAWKMEGGERPREYLHDGYHPDDVDNTKGNPLGDPLREPDPEDYKWHDGDWAWDPEGMDLTVGYDNITRKTGSPLVAAPIGHQPAIDDANQLVQYQIGRTDGTAHVKVNTTLWTVDDEQEDQPDAPIKVGAMSLVPGAGWFLAIDRAGGEDFAYPHVVPANAWTPGQGEKLEFRITGTPLVVDPINDPLYPPCPSTRNTLGQLEWRSLFGAASTGADAHAIVKVKAVDNTEDNETVDDDFFRNDNMEVEFYALTPPTRECHYKLELRWDLLYSFEAFVPVPSRQDPQTNVPLPPYDNVTHFRNNAHVLSVGNYTSSALVSFATGSDSERIETRQTEFAAPYPIHVLYAPALPAYWVCDQTNEALCIEDLLNSVESTTTMSVSIARLSDQSGITVMAWETFEGEGLSVVHHIRDDHTYDGGDSSKYELKNGDLEQSAYYTA